MNFWGNYYRIIIALVGFFCLVSICSNYIIINFTFICMKDDYSNLRDLNGTTVSTYDYTPNEKKLILWAVAAGTIIGTFPINYIYSIHGAKWPFFLSGLLSVVTTALIPLAAKYDFYFLLGIRFFQGFAYAADFAAIGIIISKWAPLHETALFISLLTSFTSIASIITNGMSGVLCASSLGWKWSFYLHSIAGMIVFCLWIIIYSDNPAIHKSVSKKELEKIQKNKTVAEIAENGNSNVPYMKIFTSPVILCVWLCAFTELSTLVLIATYAPIYFRNVLEFSFQEVSLYLGIIMAVHIPLRFVCAVISDKWRWISERRKIHIFNTLAVGAVGLSFSLFGYIPKEQKYVAVFVLGILECFISFNCGGFYKCGTLHARQYAHIVISAIQFTKCVALFSGPAVVAYFVTDEADQTQWRNVFNCVAVFMILANILSFVFFTDKPAKWTKSEAAETSPVDCQTREAKRN